MACVHTVELPKDTSCVQISYNGNTRAVGLACGDILLQSAQSGRTTTRISGNMPVREFTFSPDAKWLAVVVCNRNDLKRGCVLRLWDRKRARMFTLACAPVTHFPVIVFSPCSRLLAYSLHNGEIHVWRIDCYPKFRRVLKSPNHKYMINSLTTFSREMLVSFLCTDESTLVLWRIPSDLDADFEQEIYRAPSAIYAVACSPTEPGLLAVGGPNGSLHIIDTKNGGAIRHSLWCHNYSLVSLSFSPCGRYLASNYTTRVRLWDVATGACLRVLPLSGFNYYCVEHMYYDIMFLENGNQLAARNDDVLRVYTLCKWSEQTHHLFIPQVRRRIVWVLCARARLTKAEQNMPYEIWLMIFEQLATASLNIVEHAASTNETPQKQSSRQKAMQRLRRFMWQP